MTEVNAASTPIIEDLLEVHKPECHGIGQTVVSVEMPEENKLCFQNWHKQLLAPYIVYADFKTVTFKIEGPELDPSKSNMQNMQHHEACGYSYTIVHCDGQIQQPVVYQGPNVAEHLLKELQDEEHKNKAVLVKPKIYK